MFYSFITNVITIQIEEYECLYKMMNAELDKRKINQVEYMIEKGEKKNQWKKADYDGKKGFF